MHNAEFRRCLVEMDVAGIRRLWQHVSPHLPQPKNDDEALFSIHKARVGMTTLPASMVTYSERWLAEREMNKIAMAVGISVNAPPHRREQAMNIRHAMSGAVTDAIRDGVDMATEAFEIRRRMMASRARA